MTNPYEVERDPEPEDPPHRLCCFCPLAIDDEETVAIVSADRVNGYQVAHVSCAAECPECRRMVKAPLIQVNPKLALCGDCTRNLIEQATGGWAL